MSETERDAIETLRDALAAARADAAYYEQAALEARTALSTAQAENKRLREAVMPGGQMFEALSTAQAENERLREAGRYVSQNIVLASSPEFLFRVLVREMPEDIAATLDSCNALSTPKDVKDDA